MEKFKEKIFSLISNNYSIEEKEEIFIYLFELWKIYYNLEK